jgi:hypothetical protein
MEKDVNIAAGCIECFSQNSQNGNQIAVTSKKG